MALLRRRLAPAALVGAGGGKGGAAGDREASEWLFGSCFSRPPSSERPLPMHLVQLCSAVLTRILAAFAQEAPGDKERGHESLALQKQPGAFRAA